LLVAFAFASFGIGAFLLGVVILPAAFAWKGPLVQRHRRCQRVVAACFRVFCRALSGAGLVAFDVDGALADARWPRSRQFVAVANHPSLLETIAAISVVGPVCCVVAPWLSSNPLIRPLLACSGHVTTRNDSLASRLAAFEAASTRLQMGHSLLVFPEGTRSPKGTLGEFQRGAFELALRAGLPILPVACRVTPPVLTRDSAWYDLPDQTVVVELVPLDVFEPFDYLNGRLDARKLTAAVRDRLLRALDLPRDNPSP
jgi:1-acyl-sn-glycerol-3-phosphate acyltransferase